MRAVPDGAILGAGNGAALGSVKTSAALVGPLAENGNALLHSGDGGIVGGITIGRGDVDTADVL